MIDQAAAILALRSRATSLIVCTTGSVTLTATTTGYSRSTGSFITDGFRVGMELTPSGYLSNPVDAVLSVTDLVITTANSRSAEPATNASLTVGLPAIRGWENERVTTDSRRLWVDESFVPGTQTVVSLPVDNGLVEETGLYVIRLYGLAETGINVRDYTTALLKRYAPGTSLALASGSLRIRSDLAPYASQIIRLDSGWAVSVLTIPWRAYSLNQIAA